MDSDIRESFQDGGGLVVHNSCGVRRNELAVFYVMLRLKSVGLLP